MKISNFFLFAIVSVSFVVLFTVTGCAQNKPVLATPDGSQPNEYSAYLYSAGNVLKSNGDFAGAESVFRLASLYDPHSTEIKKAIFSVLMIRAEDKEIPLTYLEGYVDSLLVQKAMDKTMLEEAYNIFARADNNLKAKELLDIYLKKYSTARAYTSLFYLEQILYNKSRLELLDKAYKHAGTDASFLNSLGYLYLAYDSTKAETIWNNARKFDTTTQSAQFLWALYSKQNNTVKLHKLWNSFRLPDEKEKLSEMLNRSFEEADFLPITMLSDVILNSNEPQFILYLLQSSWYLNKNELFEQSWNKLQKMQLNTLDSQLAYFYAALYYLKNDDYPAALNWISRLNGKNALDELVSIYRATSLMGTTETDTTKVYLIKQKLIKTIEPSMEGMLAAPVKRYLLAVADSLGYNNEISVADSITWNCVEWFYKNRPHTYDTYYWLALYYTKTKQDTLSKAILREALDEYPEDAALLNWLGYSYVLSGDNLDEAEVLIRRALQLAPDNPYYLDSLGWLCFLKGDFKQAGELMEIPATLEQMPSEIAFHLGSVYNSLKDTERATRYLKLAIEVNDDPEAVAKAKTLLDSIKP